MTSYPIRQDGEWMRVENRRHRIACCDCGLIHDFEFRVRKRKVEFRVYRNNRATAQRRRYLKHSPLGGKDRLIMALRRVHSIEDVPPEVLGGWRDNWSPQTGFSRRMGDSLYVVFRHNKWDLWVWVNSNAQCPMLRGRINLRPTPSPDAKTG